MLIYIVQLYDLLFTVKCLQMALYNCMNRYSVAMSLLICMIRYNLAIKQSHV